MRKILLTVAAAVLTNVLAVADDFKTAGNNTKWTLTKLSEDAATGVTVNGKTFTMASSIEIAEGDTFAIEDGVTLRMGDNVQLKISGDALLAAAERVLITADGETAKPYGIFLNCEYCPVSITNIDFEQAGLKNFGNAGFTMDNCSFRNHNGVSGSAAIGLGTNGTSFVIRNSTFENCTRSAIGGAANYMNPVAIDSCTFTNNNTSNVNTPQINLTTASSVIITNCRIIGNPEHDKCGGIVVSNLIGLTGEMNTVIEGNEIRDNRFGIATYCEQNATIKNNIIVDNKYEQNAMNGGSGINIYDPYKTQTTMVTGNYIEGNLWGITVIGGKDVNIGKTEDETAADYNPGLNIFFNNGNGGVIYDIYNNSANTVYAQGNYWKSVEKQDRESIETVVYHKNDNASLGEVIFMPALTDDPTSIDNTTHSTAEPAVAVYRLDGTMAGRSTAGLQRGVYIVRTTGANGTETRKINIR